MPGPHGPGIVASRETGALMSPSVLGRLSPQGQPRAIDTAFQSGALALMEYSRGICGIAAGIR